jgi:hypothetical protein
MINRWAPDSYFWSSFDAEDATATASCEGFDARHVFSFEGRVPPQLREWRDFFFFGETSHNIKLDHHGTALVAGRSP